MANDKIILFVRGIRWYHQLVANLISFYDYEMAIEFIIRRVQYKLGETGSWRYLK